MSFEELKRVLLLDKPSEILRKRRNELCQLIPEFADTFDFDQRSDWHNLDVFEHILKVVDGTDNCLVLRLAALFHDIGKPSCMVVDDNNHGHFFGHWEESERLFTKYQDNFSLSEEEIYLIRKLIFYHDLDINDESVNVFKEEFSNEDLSLLLSLKKADSYAYHPNYKDIKLNQILQEEKLLQLEYDSDDSEKYILLALFCNQCEYYTYKKRVFNDDMEKSFIVGIQCPAGIAKYCVPMKYWDYFQILEVSYADSEGNDSLSNVEKLKSFITLPMEKVKKKENDI